jgi:hypothetical protein
MVVVAVGDKDKIGPQPLRGMGCQGIAFEPWVDEDGSFSVLQSKTGVAIIGNFHLLLLSG